MARMNEQLIKRVEDKVLDTLLLAQRLYNRAFELPKLSFDLSSSKIAGQAFLHDWKIKINPRFLQSNSEEVINVTVPHEVAHLVCFVLHPRAKQAHGPEWKGIMQDFGLKPNIRKVQDSPTEPSWCLPLETRTNVPPFI